MSRLKFLKTSIAALLCCAAFTSQAAVITFDFDVAGDNSGKTSQFIDPTQAVDGNGVFGVNGYFIETFDAATAMNGFPAGTLDFNNSSDSDGCAINSTGAGVTVGGSGSFEVRASGKGGVAAAPAGDETCFAYTPAEGGNLGSVELDYSALLTAASGLLGTSVGIDYFGFYWGSVDTYNDFSFFNGDNLIVEITGQSLLNTLNGNTGNQLADSSNVYVNVAFAPGDSFNKVVINSTGVAGEVDNIVVGFDTPVPVSGPSTIALSSLALLGMAGLRRRKVKS
ncbi:MULTISPECIES: Npun_F0296 family exosortase-dependent surface protein [unclassified Alteromonas]|uniref:Npun_F0296 family exosortase-dependent surface protein n=1 Tax=unclassified Alteromonas TaxID=2614992 RepID=UPI000509F9FF|nr:MULTISPECIES: hypothetical protein [unclassified Alteromonas]